MVKHCVRINFFSRVVEEEVEVETEVDGSGPMVSIEHAEEVVLMWNNAEVRLNYYSLNSE